MIVKNNSDKQQKVKTKQTHKKLGTTFGYRELKENHNFSYSSKSILQNLKKWNYRRPIIILHASIIRVLN